MCENSSEEERAMDGCDLGVTFLKPVFPHLCCQVLAQGEMLGKLYFYFNAINSVLLY